MFDAAYISENLPFCPAETAAIADLWHGRLDEANTWSHSVRATDRLWLGAELRRVTDDRFGIRQTPGILWVGGLPVRISFELSVWSTGMTTMAIRPRGRASIAGGPSYVAAADRALRDITRAFVATRDSVGATKPSYRAVTETVSERTFAWPTPSGATSSLRPKVTAPGSGRSTRVMVGIG
jgi:hypothetical protein